MSETKPGKLHRNKKILMKYQNLFAWTGMYIHTFYVNYSYGMPYEKCWCHTDTLLNAM